MYSIPGTASNKCRVSTRTAVTQSGTMVAGMTSVRAVEQTRMGIAALLVSNIGWGVLPLYWHALSGMNAISVLAYRLIATLAVMIALLMASRRYRAYHRAIAAL